MRHSDARFDMLVQSLKLLATTAEDLVGLFPRYVCIPGELWSEFDHWFNDPGINKKVLGEEYLSIGLLEPTSFAKIKSIHDALARMVALNDPLLWTIEALTHSTEWKNIRSQANEVILQLGETPSVDRLRNITFVPGPPKEDR